MIRWFSSNRGLIVLSFFLAVGLVWMRGQERLDSRSFSHIKILIENLPKNLTFPKGWNLPTTTVTIYGPRKTLDLIRTDQSNFLLDVSQNPIQDDDEEVPYLLTDSMFKSNLEPAERQRISLDESIKQRRVILHILPWNIQEDPPVIQPANNTANRIEIPVFRLEKRAKIVVPLQGKPAEGYELSLLDVTPKDILVTGPREVIDRVQSVSTTPLEINGLSESHPGLYLTLDALFPAKDVRLVDNTVTGVTVSFDFKKKGK